MVQKPKMYLMTGKPGAGKSTFAKGFCEQFNLWHLDVDEFYKIYNGGQCHEHSFEVWITMFNAIHTAGREGRDILVDTNAENHEDRYQFCNGFQNLTIFLFGLILQMKCAYGRTKCVIESFPQNV